MSGRKRRKTRGSGLRVVPLTEPGDEAGTTFERSQELIGVDTEEDESKVNVKQEVEEDETEKSNSETKAKDDEKKWEPSAVGQQKRRREIDEQNQDEDEGDGDLHARNNRINLVYQSRLALVYEFAVSLAGELGKKSVDDVWSGPVAFEDSFILDNSQVRTLKECNDLEDVFYKFLEEDGDGEDVYDAPPVIRERRIGGAIGDIKKAESGDLGSGYGTKDNLDKYIDKHVDMLEEMVDSGAISQKLAQKMLEEHWKKIYSMKQARNARTRKNNARRQKLLDPVTQRLKQELLESLIKYRQERAYESMDETEVSQTVWHGVIDREIFRYFTPVAKRGIENALRDIHQICRHPEVVLFDVMTHEEVRGMFASFAAAYIKRIEVERPSSYTQIKMPLYHQQYVELARKRFYNIAYNRENKLVFVDVYDPSATRERNMRQRMGRQHFQALEGLSSNMIGSKRRYTEPYQRNVRAQHRELMDMFGT